MRTPKVLKILNEYENMYLGRYSLSPPKNLITIQARIST